MHTKLIRETNHILYCYSRELQKLMADERRAKELLEQQLKEIKNQVVGKTQNKILAAELEIANNKLKQAEAAVRETPPMLISLQAEIATLRKQHRNAIHEVILISID